MPRGQGRRQPLAVLHDQDGAGGTVAGLDPVGAVGEIAGGVARVQPLALVARRDLDAAVQKGQMLAASRASLISLPPSAKVRS